MAQCATTIFIIGEAEGRSGNQKIKSAKAESP